ncbi:hypothetical protein [Vibrio parahaemolyticus]|uniref:hypothetical protein n=1 Tax=Vibrio parahaemolyticus TaxID=670 RepID=UPI000C86DBD1|nr:hypothetical protein [Vibrio parahaemolyticus]EIA1494026.1 hypothetical protein [Vibrio parahaemolyticus]PMT62623.1 hypothetical protein C1S87_03605 [Vibrio parahaemolyticus]PMT89407.1 hypothetical protein C1S83_03605 [Vibrio parahaemolyticus]PMT92667.1 hypothetical protein C1T03_03605 [Vibrio parahaemolyticus]HCG8562171.1 hypothetical protein [Vibrio parahaemolyticus]
MLNEFKTQSKQTREKYKDEFVIPPELETAFKTFVQACIDYRVDMNGRRDFIENLMQSKNVTITSLTGLLTPVCTTLVREQVTTHFTKLAEQQSKELHQYVRGNF